MDQFSVRLECLDDLGNKRLPAIRDSMAAALAALDKAADWITSAFDTEGRSYRDYLKRVFADNCENVDLAARAIRETALRYRQADGRA